MIKILFLFLLIHPTIGFAGARENITQDCQKAMSGKAQSQDEKLKFCSCFSDYILFKNTNPEEMNEVNKKKLYRESAASCSSQVHVNKAGFGWTDQMKGQMVQKCKVDPTSNKITKEMSVGQKQVYCECYVGQVTKSIKLSEIKILPQDKLMEKLASKVVQCKKTAENVLY